MFEKQIQRKPKLTVEQLDYCFAHVLRDSELFNYVKQHLKPTDFELTTEARYALIWTAALAAASRNGDELPLQGTERIIGMELLSKINNAGSNPGFTHIAAQSAYELLTWSFAFKEEDLNPTYYKSLIQDLIIERTVLADISRDMVLSRDLGRPINILQHLEKYNHKLQTLMLDHSEAGKSAFPVNFKPKKIGKFSTGEKFLDNFMNGGQAPGEVYVLLGPTGLGKTSLAVMVTVSTARVWNAAFQTGIIPQTKVSCFFSWEQDLERLRHRFWAYAARIDSSRLELYADEAIQLSVRGKLEKYEYDEFKEEIAIIGADKFNGELERLQASTLELSESVHIFDFSGSAENPRLGEGGIDEIAAVLKALQKQGKEIGVVVLDYANAAVRKMMSARGERPEGMRHYLANFCNECRFKIAIPFNCPVWVLNQLNTESNRRAPTAQQHHSFASECGNFAENAWFAFVFSTKDKVNNTCQLFCTKERRAKGDRPPAILRIDGNFCRMRDVSDLYVVDELSKQFVVKSMSENRIDPAEFNKRAARNDKYPGLSDMMDE